MPSGCVRLEPGPFLNFLIDSIEEVGSIMSPFRRSGHECADSDAAQLDVTVSAVLRYSRQLLLAGVISDSQARMISAWADEFRKAQRGESSASVRFDPSQWDEFVKAVGPKRKNMELVYENGKIVGTRSVES